MIGQPVVKGKCIFVRCKDVEDLLTLKAHKDLPTHGAIVAIREDHAEGVSWLGIGPKYSDCYRVWKSGGWEKGLTKLKDLTSEALPYLAGIPPVLAVKRTPELSKTRGRLIVKRAITGKRHYRLRHVKVHTNSCGTDTIRVMVPLQAASNVTAGQYMYRGLAVHILMRMLEGTGYSVQVDGVAYSKGVYAGSPNPDFCATFGIKDAGAKYNPARMAGYLCAPALHRTGVFIAKGSVDPAVTKGALKPSMGCPASARQLEEVAREIGTGGNEVSIVAPPIKNRGEAVEWLREVVERLNG